MEQEAEQTTISLLVKRAYLMPDGSIGCVLIGEFAGDRDKALWQTASERSSSRRTGWALSYRFRYISQIICIAL